MTQTIIWMLLEVLGSVLLSPPDTAELRTKEARGCGGILVSRVSVYPRPHPANLGMRRHSQAWEAPLWSLCLKHPHWVLLCSFINPLFQQRSEI